MAISASYDTLFQQAKDVAESYFRAAVRNIDAQFGEGYAKAHPELIAALIKAASADMNTATLAVAIQEATEGISDALRNTELANAVREAGSEIASTLG